MRDQIKAVMARIFEVPEGQLPDDAAIAEVPQWDSLKHLELMLELENEFSVSIPAPTMLELFTLNAIEEYLKNRVPVATEEGSA